MKLILDGEYGNIIGLGYRNKGLPEIYNFLTNDYVLSPIILTNKIFCLPQKNQYIQNKYNFQGSLFTWILKTKDI